MPANDGRVDRFIILSYCTHNSVLSGLNERTVLEK